MYDRATINFHVMKKLGLIEPCNSIIGALRAVGLLDAGSLPNAYYSLFLRAENSSAAAIAWEVQVGRMMARVPGLKGAPQVVPRGLMPEVFTLSKENREGRASSLLKRWRIGDEEYQRARKAIILALDGKEKTLPQLKNSLQPGMVREAVRGKGKRKERSTNVAIVAQAMWLRWELLRGGVGRSPFEDPGRYSSYERRFGGLDLDQGRDEAIDTLAKVYMDRYGPVSDEDLAWWTGIRKDEARKAIEAMPGLEKVEVEGISGDFYSDREDVASLVRARPAVCVHFLPADDPYVKAYANRDRFVPVPYRGKVITRFGESAPVVLLDGEVMGFWQMEDEACIAEVMWDKMDGREAAIQDAASAAGRFLTGGPVCLDLRSADQ